MANLIVANVNISNTLVTQSLTANGLSIDSDITVGVVEVNSSQITVGSSFINSTAISVPQLTLGGIAWAGSGGSFPGFGAIVNTQIFTANGTWTNPTANASLGLTGNEQVFIMMWGGGGGGSGNSSFAAGGGGGAGWTTATTQNSNMPGRGNAGGGKGGGTWIVSNTGLSNYYSRGIDALANTGSGGGGGASNQNNASSVTANHLANTAIVYDTANANQYLWNPVYNCTTLITAAAAIYATNGLRITIQDVGNAKVQTGVNAFPILPRTVLDFTGVAARLTTAPAGVTSTQFPGLAKRIRPTIRWKTYDMQTIREDRPAYDIVFTAVNTVTYLNNIAGQTTAVGAWQDLQAPVNAAYFDVTWEALYLDAGDVIDVDFNSLVYFPYSSFGGNGADGLAIVRWFDKAVF